MTNRIFAKPRARRSPNDDLVAKYMCSLRSLDTSKLQGGELEHYGPMLWRHSSHARMISRHYWQKIKALLRQHDYDKLEELLTKIVFGQKGLRALRSARKNGHEPANYETFMLDRSGLERGQFKHLMRDLELRLFVKFMPAHILERLVYSLLRFVITIAVRLRKRESQTNAFLDLIQAGNLGVIYGLFRYDFRRGTQLSTYVSHWIMHFMKRQSEEKGYSSFARVPCGTHDQIYRISKFMSTFYAEHGRSPEVQEIVAKLELSAKTVGAVLSLMPTLKPVLLGSTIFEDQSHDDSKRRVRVVAAASDSLSPEDALVAKEELESLRKLRLAVLEKVEGIKKERIRDMVRDAFLYRVFLSEKDERTLAQVGQRFGRTRERIRQLQKDYLEQFAGELNVSPETLCRLNERVELLEELVT